METGTHGKSVIFTADIFAVCLKRLLGQTVRKNKINEQIKNKNKIKSKTKKSFTIKTSDRINSLNWLKFKRFKV